MSRPDINYWNLNIFTKINKQSENETKPSSDILASEL